MFRTKYKIPLWRVGWLAWTVWSFRNMFSDKISVGIYYLYCLMCLVSQCSHLWWQSRGQMVTPNLVKQDAVIGYYFTIVTGAFQLLLFQSDGQYFPKRGSWTFEHFLNTFEHLWAPASQQCDLGSWCWSHVWIEFVVGSLPSSERFFSMY